MLQEVIEQAAAPGLEAELLEARLVLGADAEAARPDGGAPGWQRTALACAHRLGDRAALAHVHYDLGNVSGRLGDYRAADEHVRKALELFTDLGDRASVGRARYGLAVLLDQQDRYDEALNHAVEALRLRRSFADRAAVAYSENAVGWILAHPASPTRRCGTAAGRWSMHTESGSRSGVADTLDSIAFAYGQARRTTSRSIAHYEQALAMLPLLGDPQGEAIALADLGDMQLAAGLARAPAQLGAGAGRADQDPRRGHQRVRGGWPSSAGTTPGAGR